MATAADRAKQGINAGTRAPAPAAPPQQQTISSDLLADAAGRGIQYNPTAASRKVLRGNFTSREKKLVRNYAGTTSAGFHYEDADVVHREEQDEDDALNEYYLLPKDALATLQKRLEKGGFLKPGSYTLGVHDNGASYKAWADAIDLAANFYEAGNKDITIDQVIEQGSQNPEDQASIYIMPEDDIRAIVSQIAPKVFGKQADEGVIESLVATFQQTQAARQAGGMSADDATPGAAWVQDQLQALNPQSAQAFQGATNVQSFLKLVSPEGEFSAYRQ